MNGLGRHSNEPAVASRAEVSALPEGRHQDHRQRGVVAAQEGQQLEAVHVRHPQVGQHQVDRLGLQHRDRLDAVGGGGDPHAAPLVAQALGQGEEHRGLVIHHQNRFHARHLTSHLQSGLVYGCDPPIRLIRLDALGLDAGASEAPHEPPPVRAPRRPAARSRRSGGRRAGPLSAPAASVFASEPTSWHTVRPGETLRGIAARFLGSSELWQEIHRLNPGIADPDRIAPGQRIRVPAEKSSIPAARLERLSRQVEEQPSPIPWQSAQVGDMLVERDAVRTRQKSSAEMQFLDGARLTVTEDSLVFLQPLGQDPARGPEEVDRDRAGAGGAERAGRCRRRRRRPRSRSSSATPVRPRGPTARARPAPAPAAPRRGAPS